jgi:hypothetical protein
VQLKDYRKDYDSISSKASDLSRQRTHAFKNMLASPSMDDDAIDEVYHDATKAQ